MSDSSSSAPKKWSKKDLRALRGAIDSWWLHNRMYLSRAAREGLLEADLAELREQLKSARVAAGWLSPDVAWVHSDPPADK